MAKVDLLRKLIREEVRAVFQEELAGILREAVGTNKQSRSLTEVRRASKPVIPGTLNTQPMRPVAAPNLGTNNPLTSLLAETAQSMATEDIQSLSFTSTDAQGFNIEMPQMETPVVSNVTDMMATARPSSNFDAVQINAVPDFTQLMSKLKASGGI